MVIKTSDEYLKKLNENYKNKKIEEQWMNNLTTFNKNDFFKKLDEDYEKIKINYKTLNTEYLIKIILK